MIVTKNERIPRASKPKKGKRKKRKNRKKNLHDLSSQYSKFAEFHVRVDRGAVTSSNEFVIRLNNSAASRRTFLDESFKNGSSVHSSNFYSSPFSSSRNLVSSVFSALNQIYARYLPLPYPENVLSEFWSEISCEHGGIAGQTCVLLPGHAWINMADATRLLSNRKNDKEGYLLTDSISKSGEYGCGDQ